MKEWTESLGSLVHPEHRLLSWVSMVEDAAKQGQPEQHVAKLMQLMVDDVATEKEGYGSYNKTFSKQWGKYFDGLMKRKQSIN